MKQGGSYAVNCGRILEGIVENTLMVTDINYSIQQNKYLLKINFRLTYMLYML